MNEKIDNLMKFIKNPFYQNIIKTVISEIQTAGKTLLDSETLSIKIDKNEIKIKKENEKIILIITDTIK
jgi:hypothetical protein